MFQRPEYAAPAISFWLWIAIGSFVVAGVLYVVAWGGASEAYPITTPQLVPVYLALGGAVACTAIWAVQRLRLTRRRASLFAPAGYSWTETDELHRSDANARGAFIFAGSVVIAILSGVILNAVGLYDRPNTGYSTADLMACQRITEVDGSYENPVISECLREGWPDSEELQRDRVEREVRDEVCSDPSYRQWITDWDEQCG